MPPDSRFVRKTQTVFIIPQFQNHFTYLCIEFFCKIANCAYTPSEFDAILRRLQKLEHQIDVIRLFGYLSSVPLQKTCILEHLYHQSDNPYSVQELCVALGAVGGVFCNHIFRRADQSRHENEQAQLILRVKQVFDDRDQRFGSEKIRVVLVASGIHVSAKRVADIMQELGLYGIRADAKKQIKQKQQYAKQALPKQELSADHPSQTRVSNITYFKIRGCRVYLCIFLHLYSHKIIV